MTREGRDRAGPMWLGSPWVISFRWCFSDEHRQGHWGFLPLQYLSLCSYKSASADRWGRKQPLISALPLPTVGFQAGNTPYLPQSLLAHCPKSLIGIFFLVSCSFGIVRTSKGWETVTDPAWVILLWMKGGVRMGFEGQFHNENNISGMIAY